MRSGGGKAKGSQFEREVCKLLSLWLSQGKVEDVLWRSAMSGGRSTVAHAKGKRLAAQAGDISAIHPLGNEFISKFMVECKTYHDLQYVGLLSNRGHLVKFWLEAKHQARRYDKLPLLIAKQNQQPATVCLNRKGFALLGIEPKYNVLTAHRLGMHIILLDTFLRTAKPW